MVTSDGSRWSFVPWLVGMALFAAGAADGHDLVVSARDADWALLIRTDLEVLGGFWLLSGRFPRGARVAAISVSGILLSYDLMRAIAGHPARDVFGRVTVGSPWVLFSDLVLVAGLLCWQSATRPRTQPRRLAALMLIAAAIGVAIDRSQVGQFPIVATVRAGRSSSGLDYLVYLPDGYYRSWKRWPLILTLHGRGESGDDLNLVRRQGLPLRVEGQGGLSFVIVAPQSPDWTWNIEALARLLDEVSGRYRVDADRVFLVGNSMGGTGTWALASYCPERFAAIAPICGKGNPDSVGRLRDVPVWAFHGAEDRIVPLKESERMIAALKQAGGEARLTVYPGVGHDAWTPSYANPEFYQWLSRQSRRGRLHGAGAGTLSQAE